MTFDFIINDALTIIINMMYKLNLLYFIIHNNNNCHLPFCMITTHDMNSSILTQTLLTSG